MIEFVREGEGNSVGVRASGKLTGAVYERVLTPHLGSLIERHGKLRVLFLMDARRDGEPRLERLAHVRRSSPAY